MKLPSIRLFFFALNGFVSASPLNPFNEPNGNLLVSPSPDGGLLSPTQKPRNPNIHEGKACSVRLVRKPSSPIYLMQEHFVHLGILHSGSLVGT